MSARVAFFAAVLPLLAQLCYGQSSISVQVSVLAASQQDAPLQVMEFRTIARKEGPRVVLRNNSNSLISSFLVEATLSLPCSTRTPVKVHRLGGHWQNTVVEAKSLVDSKEQLLAPPALLSFLAKNEQPYLHVQVGVAEVRLADGTVWKAPVSDQHFTPSLVTQDTDRCAAWPPSHLEGAPSSVKFLQKAKRTIGINTTQENGQLGYVLTCKLNGAEAYCPVD